MKRLLSILAALPPFLVVPAGAAPAEPPAACEEGRQGLTRQEARIDYAEELAEEDRLLADGMKRFSEGRVEEAQTIFQKVLAINPQSANAYFNLGVVAEERGDLSTALHNYRTALNLAPGEEDIAGAVAAVEGKLSKQLSVDARNSASREFELAAARAKKEPRARGVRSPSYPVLNVTQAPVGNVPERGRNVSNRSAVARAALGVAVGVGAGFVPGLHCPACRLIRLGF